MKKRAGIETDTLIPWIVGALVLVLGVILYISLTSKGGGGIDLVKNTLGNSRV